MSRRYFRFILPFAIAAAVILGSTRTNVTVTAQSSSVDPLDLALFTRVEFFGSQAIVPFPTAQARENLARFSGEFPGRTDIILKLAETDEKLGRYADAESGLSRLAETDPTARFTLADFYHRRGRFADEAGMLRKILASSPNEEKAPVLDRLLTLARLHGLREFRTPAFLRQLAVESAETFDVLVRISDSTAEEEKEESLRILREAKAIAPTRADEVLHREVELLTSLGRGQEAERLYTERFDPLWSAERTDAFYQFLSDRERLREYGAQLKSNPADLRAAMRLAHYLLHNYEDPNPVLLNLERTKTAWTADELLGVARLFIKADNGDAASRFLYTLANRDDVKEKGDVRSRAIYQLFEIFSDADHQDLSLTAGDLGMYRSIAAENSNPGISTGILSLLFADSNVGREFADREAKAQKFFNRAAAYRLFRAFREENPASPEAAQMHLDIVSLYAAAGEPKIAEQTLNEFIAAYKTSADLPDAALKLADAYRALGRFGEMRAVYAETLDHLDPAVGNIGEIPDRNKGIKIPKPKRTGDAFYAATGSQFHDHLGPVPAEITYSEVLSKYINSLSNEKKNPEILEVLSREIQKHPGVEWLHQTRLEWLEKTNLVDEQLAAHRQALDQFQSTTWRDKLARWLIRQNRKSEFTAFSTGLVDTLDEPSVREFLLSADAANPSVFDSQLKIQLYLAAHRRFPHAPEFVTGLLRLYAVTKQEEEWQRLAAENYFAMEPVRKMFLDRLVEKGELRSYLAKASGDNAVYKLFRADAAMRLSNFEQAIDAYRELNSLYPNSTEFSEPLIALTRSFGQRNSAVLEESATIAAAAADHQSASADLRTRSGELQAEMGNFEKARVEWDKIPETEAGRPAAFQAAAAVFWDYFQYNDALRTIGEMRAKFGDRTLSSFEAAAIRESLHDTSGAIAEYVKALDSPDSDRAIRQLKKLGGQTGMEPIAAAFQSELRHGRDGSRLTLGYADLLQKMNKPDEAEAVLTEAMAAARDAEFLNSAREFFSAAERPAGERAALRRLSETSDSPRRKIGYFLEIAESFAETRDREAARDVLRELNNTFPDNAGVVFETADFYKRLGFESDGISMLEAALRRSGSRYRGPIAQRLSRLLVSAGRDADAELILTEQHRANKLNLGLFRELANVAVRQGHTDLIREAFSETLSALKESDVDRRELDAAVANLRTSMIDAFTKLGDYRAAVEQYIELINREPENETLLSTAIAYARRYGGGDMLLGYYQKTSAEAFRNYRWNVVLARIHESRNDPASAIKCYRDALVNQPEMFDLHASIAALEADRGNIDAALKDIDTALELSNDDPAYIKQKIDILKKAGRNREAETEAQKLSKSTPRPTPSNDLAAALEQTDGEQAAAAFRSAFAALIEDPLKGELTAAGVNGYVNVTRRSEQVDIILARLWELRGNLTRIATEPNSAHAADARTRISILDGAIVESVGTILSNVATDEEIAGVYDFLNRRIEEASGPDPSLSLVRNLAHRGDLGKIEETLLLKAAASAVGTEKQNTARDLIAFYESRGAYAKALETVERLTGDLRSIAKFSRLTGDAEKERATLRSIYFLPLEKPVTERDADVERFLNLLYKNNRDDLTELAGRASAYQLQLINFLLAKGEKTRVHRALESSGMTAVWKLSRHAEASLALRELGRDAECYFCDALGLRTIGEMTARPADPQNHLVGDEWFRLAREYGEWLHHSPDRSDDPTRYLAGLIEDQPRNPAAQIELGRFYLDQGAFSKAIEHYRLAVELGTGDADALAGLGAAYARSGRRDRAVETWNQTAENADPADLLRLFRTGRDLGATTDIRYFLIGAVVQFLSRDDADNSEDIQQLVREIAASFENSRACAAYFENILKQRPTDLSLAKLLLEENLVAAEHTAPFFERVMELQEEFYGSDYQYEAVTARAWSREDAESIYDHETDFEPRRTDDDSIAWRRRYLENLLERKSDTKAAELCTAIEQMLDRRYTRPDWLRMERLRLNIRAGRSVYEAPERFIGITVADSVPLIKPPSIERLNEAVRMLTEEGKDPDPLTAAFYARRLAMGDLAPGNVAAIVPLLAKQGKIDLAEQLLDILASLADPNRRLDSEAMIDRIEVVKKHAPDKTRIAESPASAAVPNARSLAADIAVDIGMRSKATKFRQDQRASFPADAENNLKLSDLLIAAGDNSSAAQILSETAADRNTARELRWLARRKLNEVDPNSEIPTIAFDPYSLFFRGLHFKDAGVDGDAATSFIDSLIAGNRTRLKAREELIKTYADLGLDAAAVELGRSVEIAKTDELLGLLSTSAERIGDLAAAITFEERRANAAPGRLAALRLRYEDSQKPIADLKVDLNNTRTK